MTHFSKQVAQALAQEDRNYVVRRSHNGQYVVWDCRADHHVEFNDDAAERVMRSVAWRSQRQ